MYSFESLTYLLTVRQETRPHAFVLNSTKWLPTFKTFFHRRPHKEMFTKKNWYQTLRNIFNVYPRYSVKHIMRYSALEQHVQFTESICLCPLSFVSVGFLKLPLVYLKHLSLPSFWPLLLVSVYRITSRQKMPLPLRLNFEERQEDSAYRQ